MSSGGVARGAALAMGAAAVAHVGPGVVAWRRGRCAVLPRLAGIGRLDHVALTFDDGPHPVSTPLVLDALERFGWHATFFCLGSEARRHPGTLREIARRGHEVAVHGDTHRSHLLRSALDVSRDVISARDSIGELSGQSPRWFRPPYGAVAASTLVGVHRSGMDLVLWSAWGRDWRAGQTGLSVADEVDRTSTGGDTVLLHDSDITSTERSWEATVASLEVLARRWEARGLVVGPLREHF